MDLLIVLPAIIWAYGLYIAACALEPVAYPKKINDPDIIKQRWHAECKSLSNSVKIARFSLIGGFILMMISFSIFFYYICKS
jgi:hypothetical protein